MSRAERTYRRGKESNRVVVVSDHRDDQVRLTGRAVDLHFRA